MIPVLKHIRALWPGAGIWLPVPFVLWGVVCLATGTARGEHVILLGVPLLAYASAPSKRVFLGLLPFGLLGLVYDAMRFVKGAGVTPDRVHVCDLRALDMDLMSVSTNGATGTVHDWLQAHSSTALDLVCALPYGTFIFIAIGFAIFLYRTDYRRMQRFGWTFFALNLAGFVTYHVYPAAPPWYFHAHGCVVDLATRASEGPNLARVDALLGMHYFAKMYGRSSDVFGAMPSLHVGYPALILMFGWPVLGNLGRALSVLFLGTMCFAAVYLDHHWTLDVLVGLTYAVIVKAAIEVVAS
jgi:inositol phosphorylceramide synthase catalytic subunit